MLFLITGIVLAFFSIPWFISFSLFIAVIQLFFIQNVHSKILFLFLCGAWGFLSILFANNAFITAQDKLSSYRVLQGWVYSLEPSSIPQYKWRARIYITQNKDLEGFFVDFFLRKKPLLLVNDKISFKVPKTQNKKIKEDLALFSRKEKIIQTFLRMLSIRDFFIGPLFLFHVTALS